MNNNNANDENAENIPPNTVNVTVEGAGLDTFIPTIPEVRTTDITAKFKIKMLTPIEGRPTYEKMQTCENELGRNALAIQVPFGGGKRGCLGLVYSPAKYLAEASVEWNVPESEGAYPTLDRNSTEDQKKKQISEFIKREKGIETVQVVEDLLKGMFLEAIDEDYIVELKDGLREYDGESLLGLLEHAKKYAKMDDNVHETIMNEFQQPPDMDLPIDKYFAKQEKTRKLLADTENPITEATMVMQMTQHLGRVGSLGKKAVKFRKREKDRRTWALGKTYFREAIEDMEDENKAMGNEPGLQANAAVVAEQNARDDIGEKMSASFDALASAAVAKSDTIDNHAATISQLTMSIAELIRTNKSLVAQLVAANSGAGVKTVNPPPGIQAPAAATTTAGQTGHVMNTTGTACPVKMQGSGRWHFVTPQACSHCGVATVKHVPDDCLALPKNAERKSIIDAMNARNAAKAGK